MKTALSTTLALLTALERVFPGGGFEVMKRVQRDMHMTEITIAYGMTETSPVSFQSATADAVRDGWMHTGGLAALDDEGSCNIVGRAKDMVIRGGENVYPREVEEFLFRHPKVAAVQVFGVPDQRYGEELAAWIITKPGQSCTEDEIRAFCRDQIAHGKVPRWIRFVDEIPVTVTGKPQQFVMREATMRELGLAAAATA